MSKKFPLVTVLGPTAVGKTTFAANLAIELDAEILSADSRQVYRGMDIGTGKDMADYTVNGITVASHLIDIAEPGTEYNVFQFQRDFESARISIIERNKTPLMCGGTGMYLEAVLKGYNFVEAPFDTELRTELSGYKEEELVAMLNNSRNVHNTTDILDRERLFRALEIEKYRLQKNSIPNENIFQNTPVLGIRFDRKIIRQRITARLMQRLDEGMVEEVQQLINSGISKDRLKMYGLEYKYIAMFLDDEVNYNQMVTLLNTAIHQFAKRQMTWFRRMENSGVKITWLEGENGLQLNLIKAIDYIKKY
jgi:tRNA dimethylallyltransferase